MKGVPMVETNRLGRTPHNLSALLAAGMVLAIWSSVLGGERVAFELHDGWMAIRVDGDPFAEYVWRDEAIRRPYFRHVRAPGGLQVTRNSPPREGADPLDHAAMHPGVWLSFGDVSGADFWRNKAETKWEGFVEPPHAVDDEGRFTARFAYRTEGKTLCREECRIVIQPATGGTLLDWTSTFRGEKAFAFGDQEEMGLGIRVATPLAVKSGGRILNSRGQRNEAEAWGKTAEWCDYRGTISGNPAGVLLMADPQNFRPSWFHVRDYGLAVANPFGRNAFTQREKSSVEVAPGEEFRLRFGLVFHAGEYDPQAAYDRWLRRLR